jgi:hypothetical protein
MHLECLEVSSALLRWSRRQPRLIAIKAELVVASLELLAKRPDDIPLRRLVAMNTASLAAALVGRGGPVRGHGFPDSDGGRPASSSSR